MARSPAEPYWKAGDHVPGLPECFQLSPHAANLANFIREATIEEMHPFVAYLDGKRGDPRDFPPYREGDVMQLDQGLCRLEGDTLMVAGNAWLTGWDAGHLKRFVNDRPPARS